MSKFVKALEQADQERAGFAPTGAREAPPARRAPERAVAEPIGEPLEGVDEHLVTLLAPSSFEAAQFLKLRHYVEQMGKASGLKVIVVSSPGIGDGKSVTAINLAGALAQTGGVRVLLVDADLRSPAVATRLGMEESESRGLVGAVVDRGLALEDVVRHLAPFNLAVLPAGQRMSSPYELLKSPRLGELLETCRGRYDFVILDTSPLVPFPDCRAVVRWADGLLLVIRAYHTPRALLTEALEVVDPARLLGVIWNIDDRPGRHDYRGADEQRPMAWRRPV